MKSVAVITDAVSPRFFFPLWHRYYSGLFGAEKLHVVTYKGMKSAFSGIELGNLWEVSAAYDDTLRIDIIADLVGALLRTHDTVIRCDVDEFLMPDSRLYHDLADFTQHCELSYVTAQGIDVIELAEDLPLDLDMPVFGAQRRYGIRSAAMNKTCMTTQPMRWAEGFHSANVPPSFAGLYNLHLKFADIKARIAWEQTMAQGLVPGGKAHDYFSVGAAHLTDVQKFLASRPIGGEETQAEFNARFLATVTHNPVNDIFQGDFLSQDFIIPLHDLGIVPPRHASRESVQSYDGRMLTEPPAFGELQVLEEPSEIPRLPPRLIADMSGRGLTLAPAPVQQLHGSYLVQRQDVLLFGPNHLVTPQGQWCCEARRFREQFLSFYTQPFYDSVYPGPKPEIRTTPEGPRLDLGRLRQEDVERITVPVFLATPVEPGIWGRWIATVVPKAAQYRQYGKGRKFFCDARHEWQRAFLELLGIAAHNILPHDPGRTYICNDVMTVEYSEADLCVSPGERVNFFALAACGRTTAALPRKLFVSRLSRSRAHPRYRVLQNEEELAAALAALGFTTIEPELHPVATQVAAFAAAEQVVFLGGSGIFSAAFCAPDSSVLTIESTATFAGNHTAFFSSLGLRHGVVFGAEDMSDPQPHHRRWTLDIARAVPIIEAFFQEA